MPDLNTEHSSPRMSGGSYSSHRSAHSFMRWKSRLHPIHHPLSTLGFIRAIYRDISWTGPYAPTFNFSAGCALICILLFEAGHLNESKALTLFSTCSTDQKNEPLVGEVSLVGDVNRPGNLGRCCGWSMSSFQWALFLPGGAWNPAGVRQSEQVDSLPNAAKLKAFLLVWLIFAFDAALSSLCPFRFCLPSLSPFMWPQACLPPLPSLSPYVHTRWPHAPAIRGLCRSNFLLMAV